MATHYLPDLLFFEGALQPDLALAVGDDGNVIGSVPAAQALAPVKLAGRALFPGLVNAHSHAFQRLIRGRTEYVAEGEGDDFWSWRERMYQVATALGPEDVYVASRQAFLEMALAGITAVGEFHYLHHAPDGRPYADRNELALQVIRAAREVGLRICLLRVGYARAGFATPENPRQKRFIDGSVDAFLDAARELGQKLAGDPLVRVGLAPHSVRAVPKAWLERVAKETGIVHMHVAEQMGEVRSCLAEHERRPVELLDEVGLLREGFTAVHAIHLEPKEVEILGETGVSVCACPSTERNLGDGIIPADELMDGGAAICLGSDSQVTIDLLEEARQLESHLRLARHKRAVLDPGGGRQSGLGELLLTSATRAGADSLGLPGGDLRPGSPADFFTVDLADPSLLGSGPESLVPALIFAAEKACVRDVAVGGKLIVRDGRHPLSEASAGAFSALSKRLFP